MFLYLGVDSSLGNVHFVGFCCILQCTSKNIKRHINCREIYLIDCISAFIGGIFLQLRALHLTGFPCQRYKFVCDRSIIKATLLGGTKYLRGRVLSSSGGIFLQRHTAHSSHMRYTHCQFGCDWLIMKGTVLVEESTFSSISPLPLEGFP